MCEYVCIYIYIKKHSPCNLPCRHIGGVDVQPYRFFFSTLVVDGEAVDQCHAPATLPCRNNLVPNTREAAWWSPVWV